MMLGIATVNPQVLGIATILDYRWENIDETVFFPLIQQFIFLNFPANLPS